MTNDLIALEVQAGIATLTLNRPDKRNAMSDEMRAQFTAALESDRRRQGHSGAGAHRCRARASVRAATLRAWSSACRRPPARSPSTAGIGNSAFITPRPCCTRCRSRRSRRSTARRRALAPTPRSRATSSSQANGRPSPGPTFIRGIVPDGGGMYFLPAPGRAVEGQGADLQRTQGRCRRGARAWHRRPQDECRHAGERCASVGTRAVPRVPPPRSRWARRSSTRASSRRRTRSSCRAARRRASATRATEHRESVMAFLGKVRFEGMKRWMQSRSS